MKFTKIFSGSFLFIIVVILYFYIIHTNLALPVLESARKLGLLGVVIAILLLAIFCILPVPSEFLVLLNMEIYGIVWGTIYSLIGGVVGAAGALLVTRYFFKSTIERISGKYLGMMNTWIHERGLIVGLLGVRFIPLIPYHVVNYAAGALGIRLWPFVWTTAIGILPFDIGMAFLSYGYHNNSLQLDLYVGLVLIVLVLLGWIFRGRLKWFKQAVKR